MTAITVDLSSLIHLSNDQFYKLCQANPDVKFERNYNGELVVMSPTGWGTGNRNSKLTSRLELWAEANGTGLAFDSSTGFKLPNGAERSPDAAWVKQERLDALNPDPDSFLPLAPDFVVELISGSDSIEKARAKMREYQDNGVRLGWLINPKERQVEIYQQGREVQVLQSPTSLSGQNVLPGFLLDLKGILFS